MIGIIVLLFATHVIHVSSGPYGWVAWIQPNHISAGIGLIHWHITAWFERG